MQLEMRAVKLKVLIKTELVLKYRANSTKYSEDPKPNMFGIQMLKNVRWLYVLFSDDDLVGCRSCCLPQSLSYPLV